MRSICCIVSKSVGKKVSVGKSLVDLGLPWSLAIEDNHVFSTYHSM